MEYLSLICATFSVIISISVFVRETKHYRKEIDDLREENCLLCYGIKACLSGLIQQGVNHDVPIAYDKLEKYLNKKAHEKG